MRLDGFGLFVEDMPGMIRFYRDVLGFEIKEAEDTSNVYLVKDGTLFLLYGRKDFEKMTHRRYDYVKGPNGHFELALYVDTFDEVDAAFKKQLESLDEYRFVDLESEMDVLTDMLKADGLLDEENDRQTQAGY